MRDTNREGLYRELAPSATVDNVRSFTTSDGKKWEMIDKKARYVVRMGGVLPGSNMLTRLNAIYADSTVKEVIFDHGDITITGTLNCQGKRTTFRNGSKIVGTCVINNGEFSGSYRDQFFGPNVSLTNCTTAMEKVSVHWFGATGDNVTDDRAAIQRGIDAIVANPLLPKDLYFLRSKKYKISNPVISYKWDGTNYLAHTVNLIGQQTAHWSSDAEEPKIILTSTNTFAIGFQRGLSCTVRGVVVEGQFFRSFTNDAAYYESNYSTWASSPPSGGTAVRDTRYSPYAGIVIDPFNMDGTNAPPADGGYPGLTSWYRGNAPSAGSSGISVKECRIFGVAVGILESPNGTTQQADNATYEKVAFSCCKAGLGTTQRQAKGNYAQQLIAWDRVHTLIDGDSWGQQQGQCPNSDVLSLAGSAIRLFNITSSQHNVNLDGIFCETIYQIGKLIAQSGTITVNGMWSDMVRLTAYSKQHGWFTNVIFNGCTFRYYDDLFDTRLNFKGYGNIFNNCDFDQMPLFYDQILDQRGGANEFNNCSAGGVIIGPSNFLGDALSRNKEIIPTRPFTIEVPQGANEQLIRRELVVKRANPDTFIRLSSFSALSTSGNTATFTTTGHAILSVGDHVTYLSTADSQVYTLGRVSAINRGTGVVSLDKTPNNINANSGASVIWACKINYLSPGLCVSLTNGSTTVSSVDQDQWGGTVPFRERYIRGVEASLYWTGSAYALRTNAQVTDTDIDIPNYGLGSDDSVQEIIQTLIWGPDTWGTIFTDLNGQQGLIKKGTIWVLLPYGGNSKTRKWICKKTGYLNPAAIGKTRQSEWVEVDPATLAPLSNNTPDSFTLTSDGSRAVNGLVSYTRVGTSLSAFKIGTTPGGEEILSAQSVSANDVITVGRYHSGTLYFGGVTSSTTITIYNA